MKVIKTEHNYRWFRRLFGHFLPLTIAENGMIDLSTAYFSNGLGLKWTN